MGCWDSRCEANTQTQPPHDESLFDFFQVSVFGHRASGDRHLDRFQVTGVRFQN